jgi:hypothetical protein
MAIDSKRIQVSELDFDQIKTNLKNYLKGQNQFSDYDFEGSGLSVLLDVLAYNTHYNALYTNLAVNEMFLDSASKRASVVSLAKSLGYTPASATSARAVVNMAVNAPNQTPSSLTLPQYSPFSTVINGINYTFYNTADVTIIPSNGLYTFTNLEIVQGTPLNFKYTVTEGQQYIIPNANADMSTLKVRVQESATSDTFTTFIAASSLVELASDSNVYFTKEIDGGLYEIIFGDNIISSGLTNGNIVHLDYFVTKGSEANGARTFTYNGSSLIGGSPVVTTISIAAGGTEVESIDSIKYNAPRLYAAQNRAVTPDDYKALIYSAFPYIQSVSVWGGEDNNPPIYGKTFICARPRNAVKLSLQQKSDLKTTLLSSRSVVSIIPEIVDPEFINIALDVTVYYNDRKTIRTASEIATLVTDTIFRYDDSTLQRFDGVFKQSQLSRLIDTTEPAIVSNITTVLMRRKVSPRYNVSAEYNLNLINPIYTAGVPAGAVSSTGFYVRGSEELHFLQDDGVGNVQLYYNVASNNSETGSTKFIVNPFIGTVDYANGTMVLRNLNITSLGDIDWEITFKPQSNDIVSAYTQIAEIARDHLTVTAIPDKTANGDLRAGKNYIFTSSRN